HNVLYTLSLHDALPIWLQWLRQNHDDENADRAAAGQCRRSTVIRQADRRQGYRHAQTCRLHVAELFAVWRIVGAAEFSSACASRSEEHTSELQSRENLV